MRLSVISHDENQAVLKIEGVLAGTAVGLLEEEGRRWLDRVDRLVLDLSHVSNVDAAGLAVLEAWAGPRLVVRGGSPYIRELIARHRIH